ncbi:hypothetical protein ACHFJ0_05120 [Paracoccus sp. NGMCC 1.201697]|uniref:Uncharacterized protein n=1 Tax=Paracoccus broussonetiae subsp. drimophilus TaxID=3373869 RepID=A0ABW7LKX9_9RHOB
MALLTKRTPAILVPVQTGITPPFGYVRDFYTELKANAAVAAMYDFHADFCTINNSNGITRVTDSLGKASPLTPFAGSTPPTLVDAGGGGANFAVGTPTARCVLTGSTYAGGTSYGLLAVISYAALPSATESIAAFGTNQNNLYFNTAGSFGGAGIGTVAGFADGQPSWGLGYRGNSVNGNSQGELGTSNGTAAAVPSLGVLTVGMNGANVTAASGFFTGILHALLVLTAVPDAPTLTLITDWAKSITPQR